MESLRAGPRNGPHAYWNLPSGCSTLPNGSFWKCHPQHKRVISVTAATVAMLATNSLGRAATFGGRVGRPATAIFENRFIWW